MGPLMGFDASIIDNPQAASTDDCACSCDNSAECKGWSYDTQGSGCTLYTWNDNSTPPVFCGSSPGGFKKSLDANEYLPGDCNV